MTEGEYDYEGTPYGSYVSPVHRGSGGGGTDGGSGGSTITLKVCKSLLLCYECLVNITMHVFIVL